MKLRFLISVAFFLVGAIAFDNLRMREMPCPRGPLDSVLSCEKDQSLLWINAWYQSVSTGPLNSEVASQLNSPKIKFNLSDFGRERELVLQKGNCALFVDVSSSSCYWGEHVGRGKHFHLLVVDGDSKNAKYYHGYWKKFSVNHWTQIPR